MQRSPVGNRKKHGQPTEQGETDEQRIVMIEIAVEHRPR